MFGIVVTKDMVKAERVIRKFSRRVQVRHDRSVVFIYCGWPVNREVCMECLGSPMTRLYNGCSVENCPVDQTIDETLIGFRALEYARVKARIVFPTP